MWVCAFCAYVHSYCSGSKLSCWKIKKNSFCCVAPLVANYWWPCVVIAWLITRLLLVIEKKSPCCGLCANLSAWGKNTKFHFSCMQFRKPHSNMSPWLVIPRMVNYLNSIKLNCWFENWIGLVKVKKSNWGVFGLWDYSYSFEFLMWCWCLSWAVLSWSYWPVSWKEMFGLFLVTHSS